MFFSGVLDYIDVARRWVLYDLGASTALSGISNGYRMEDFSKFANLNKEYTVKPV